MKNHRPIPLSTALWLTIAPLPAQRVDRSTIDAGFEYKHESTIEGTTETFVRHLDRL